MNKIVRSVLLASVLVAGFTACSTTTTEPTRKPAAVKASHDLFCESGYVIVVNEEGDPYCAPQG